MSKSHDAIVIGAGHNGLTCACHLAKAGLRVLVVEGHHQIGGMTRSEELTLPGFVCDVHAAGYQLANLSPSPSELDLASHGFELIYPPVNYAHAFSDGRAMLFHRDLEETCASIAQFSEHDAKAWRAVMEAYDSEKEGIQQGLYNPPTPGPIQPEQRQTLRSWLDPLFECEEVKTTLAAWALHLGFGPDDPGSIAGSVFGPLLQDVGNNPVRGGMQQLPNALASFLLAHGGEIRTGARVEKILVEAGRAVGVRLTDGTELEATRLVASNTNPAHVALRLLTEDEIGADVAAKMRTIEWGPAQMTIWLALDGPVAYAAGDFASQTLYTHGTDPTLSSLKQAVTEARKGWLPETPMFVFVNDGAVDPSRVPSGRSMMRILVQPLPFEIEGDATGVAPQRPWTDAREPYADYVLSRVERDFIPGLGSRILKRTVHDPLTMSIESPDCIRGGITFGMATPEQSGALRPIAELGQYRTPVSGLYLCGSGSHPGAGVSMAPGRNAAMKICEDLGLPFHADR